MPAHPTRKTRLSKSRHSLTLACGPWESPEPTTSKASRLTVMRDIVPVCAHGAVVRSALGVQVGDRAVAASDTSVARGCGVEGSVGDLVLFGGGSEDEWGRQYGALVTLVEGGVPG
jgi:hypothetical protein